MHNGGPATVGRDGTADQEGSLNPVTFIGSFPTADFQVEPSLPEVAFLGRSNVGKSSLLNAIVGRKAIARISKSPGKTRECNVYRIAERLYLVDLPGYGYARASKSERSRFAKLIETYLRTRESLSGVVWLLDVRRNPSASDLALADKLAGWEIPVLVAITKGDKFGRAKRSEQMRSILGEIGLPEDQAVMTSAVTKEGIADLQEAILALAAEVRS
ncbi:MAG: ribosome biogenesis GTP-binding protein YihA/YsxC [Gemmatimonadales bacterium]